MNGLNLKSCYPLFKISSVLDLGCGFGWHCVYAINQGAKSVVGVDISERMLEQARKKTQSSLIEYICMPKEDFEANANRFDIVLSSLLFII